MGLRRGKKWTCGGGATAAVASPLHSWRSRRTNERPCGGSEIRYRTHKGLSSGGGGGATTHYSFKPPLSPALSVRPSRPSFTLVTVSLTTPFCTMDVPSVRRLSDIQIRHSQIMTSKTRRHHPACDYLHSLVEGHKEPARGAPATNKMFYQIISTVEFPSTMSSGEDEVLSCITTICPASSAAFQTIKHLWTRARRDKC